MPAIPHYSEIALTVLKCLIGVDFPKKVFMFFSAQLLRDLKVCFITALKLILGLYDF